MLLIHVGKLSQRNTRCLVLRVSNLFDLFYRMTMVTDLHCLKHASFISSLRTMVSFATGDGTSFTCLCTFPLENTRCFVLRVCNLRGVCSQCVAANEPYTHPSFFSLRTELSFATDDNTSHSSPYPFSRRNMHRFVVNFCNLRPVCV